MLPEAAHDGMSGEAVPWLHLIVEFQNICLVQTHSFDNHITSIYLRTFELHGIALKHSPLQLMYNVIAFKVDYESKHGAVSCEALAKLYEGVKFSNPDDAAP